MTTIATRESGQPVFIVSRPRSGSSYLAEQLSLRGCQVGSFSDFGLQGGSSMNRRGYFEDVYLSLVNDQVCRLVHGNNSGSFLCTETLVRGQSSGDFSVPNEGLPFDLDEGSVQVPEDYEESLHLYTGQDWDIWGLSRMRPGTKWYRIYSRAGLGTRANVLSAVDNVRSVVLQPSPVPMLVKDPRFLVTLRYMFRPNEIRVVVLRREREATLASMRSHYGPRLFDADPFEGFDWSSNHFNYRIPPQSSEAYWNASEALLDKIESEFETLSVIIDALDGQALDEVSAWVTRANGSIRQ